MLKYQAAVSTTETSSQDKQYLESLLDSIEKQMNVYYELVVELSKKKDDDIINDLTTTLKKAYKSLEKDGCAVSNALYNDINLPPDNDIVETAPLEKKDVLKKYLADYWGQKVSQELTWPEWKKKNLSQEEHTQALKEGKLRAVEEQKFEEFKAAGRKEPNNAHLIIHQLFEHGEVITEYLKKSLYYDAINNYLTDNKYFSPYVPKPEQKNEQSFVAVVTQNRENKVNFSGNHQEAYFYGDNPASKVMDKETWTKWVEEQAIQKQLKEYEEYQKMEEENRNIWQKEQNRQKENPAQVQQH